MAEHQLIHGLHFKLELPFIRDLLLPTGIVIQQLDIQ